MSAAGEGTEGDDPTAMLMRRIIDAFAEYERLLIGARTKAALRAKRARGERAGALPFGYGVDESGRLLPVAEEQAALDTLIKMRQGGKSYEAIAQTLRAAGVAPKRGRGWHSSAVRSIWLTWQASAASSRATPTAA